MADTSAIQHYGVKQKYIDNGDGTWSLQVATTAAGGSGAVTIANGADVAEGSTTDAAYAGSGSATMVSIGKGIYAAAVAATPAGTNVIGSVLGRTSTSSVTPTVTASSAYTIGNVVGGLLTFANAVDSPNYSGLIQSLRLVCKSVQTAGFKLYVFNANPSNTTWTDKTTPSINAADLPALVGVYNFGGADSGLGTETLYIVDGVGKAVVASATSLYGILITTGAPTFTSTSDVTVTMNVLKD